MGWKGDDRTRMRKIAAGRSMDTIACEVLWSVDEELNPLLVKDVHISDTETSIGRRIE